MFFGNFKIPKVLIINMWSAEHKTSCLLNDKVIVLPKVMTRKNLQVTEWSLVAKVDMPPATFIGFYSGEFSMDRRESLYSAQVDQMHIYPFADEENITKNFGVSFWT